MFFSKPSKSSDVKHHLNNYWTKEKIPFSFFVTLSLLVVLWASYYTRNTIRDVNP